jgi:hypothetical protein
VDSFLWPLTTLKAHAEVCKSRESRLLPLSKACWWVNIDRVIVAGSLASANKSSSQIPGSSCLDKTVVLFVDLEASVGHRRFSNLFLRSLKVPRTGD